MRFLESLFVYQMREGRDIRWHGRSHTHGPGEYEIHYFIQGSASFRSWKRIETLRPGTLLITPPLEEHAIVVRDGYKPLSYYALLIRLDQEDEELAGLMEGLQSSCYQLKKSYRLFFEELKLRGLSPQKDLRRSAEHQLLSFLYLLATGDATPNPRENHHIERALEIMQSHITKEFSLKDLGQRLDLSPAYLIRLFRRTMGTTPMKYFNRLRIEMAATLLSSTDHSLGHIAQTLGYYSEFHFSRVFKQHMGEAPSRYRHHQGSHTPP